MSINYRELKREADTHGRGMVAAKLAEAVEERAIRPEELSLRRLAAALVEDGSEYVESLDPSSGSRISESAVDTSAFSNIVGTLISAKILEAYGQPEYVFSRTIPVYQSRLSGERVAGVSMPHDGNDVIGEGMPYPSVGVGEDYIDLPHTEKRGQVVKVTREAVFFDQTGQVLMRAAQVGAGLAANKEKRLVDVVIGATNNHKWKGTAYDTYQATSPWVNIKASNTLVDWTQIDAAAQLLYGMTDPNTGEPILVSAKHIIVNGAYRQAASRAVLADRIVVVSPGFATSGSPTQTEAANPFKGAYQVIDSPYVNARQSAASQNAACWFLGDLTKAFAYIENWPLTVRTAGPDHPDNFGSDVLHQFRADERGRAAVMDPRYIVKSTN